MSFKDRSNALVALLDDLSERENPFVLVGGYAVSPFNARFSTDLDVVMAPEDTETFETFLESNGFERIDRHEKHWRYATAVIEYEKTTCTEPTHRRRSSRQRPGVSPNGSPVVV